MRVSIHRQSTENRHPEGSISDETGQAVAGPAQPPVCELVTKDAGDIKDDCLGVPAVSQQGKNSN